MTPRSRHLRETTWRLQLPVRHVAARVALAAASFAVAGGLGLCVVANVLATELAETRVVLSTEIVGFYADRLPEHAALAAKLARTELYSQAPDLEAARAHAERAIELTPASYRHHLLLATVAEAQGDRAAAEAALRRAKELAPSRADVRWRLANVLVRSERVEEAVAEFRETARMRPELLPATYGTLWTATRGDVEVLRAVTSEAADAQLALASFLLDRQRTAEAVAIASALDGAALRATAATGTLISRLTSAGAGAEARQLWLRTVAREGNNGPLVWNGDFGAERVPGLDQFDWRIASSDYARVALDSGTGRTAAPSLRVEFTGKDTTRLDREAAQTIVVRPGARYRLECWVKTDGLETPEGPKISVRDPKGEHSVFASSPVTAGTSDWQPLTCEFTAPEDTPTMLVSLWRKPQFSYDDPTKGTLWLDDVTLTEVGMAR